ncbi:MAG: hemolysin D [Planctomycetota bacterium]|nr:MAG: hemolysin D [Planctomycetota bacterium]
MSTTSFPRSISGEPGAPSLPPRTSTHPARRRAQRGATTFTMVTGLVVVLGLGALGVWWNSSGGQPDTLDADRIVTVEARELLDAVTASGRVEPVARVAVMSRASGILKELFVEEGDAVLQGQLLAELDREQLEANLAQDQADLTGAEADLAAARARLEEARVGLNDPAIDYAKKESDRLNLLFKSGDVSEREVDTANRAFEEVQFRVEQVQASLPVLEAAVLSSAAGLESARAALERSQTTLREATIRSPIDGVVLTRDKEVGDGVSSILTAGGNATQIMTLGDLSTMHIEARVDEVDLGRIYAGMPARITVDAHRGSLLHGAVDRIAPAGSVDDNGIVTFEVRVAVDDPDKLLKPDMTADARLILDLRADALTLPQRALTREPGGKWVVAKVVGSGTTARTERTEIEIGLSDGLVTEIRAGLAAGDRVMLPAAPSASSGSRR